MQRVCQVNARRLPMPLQTQPRYFQRLRATLLTGALSLGGCMLAWSSTALAAEAAPGVPSDDAIYQHIEKLASLGLRMPGRAASRAASDYVHAQFTDSGLQRVAFEEAETLVWQASRWGLAVNGQALACSPMQHTFHHGVPGPFSTGPQGVNAPLVYVGNGSAWDYWGKDVRGKIVVADVPFSKNSATLFRPFMLGLQDTASTFPWDYMLVDPYSGGDFPDNYYRAMKGGALGFVGILVDYADSHQYRNEAYDAYRPGKAMSMPALWMSPVQGASLVAQIKAAKPGGVQARLQLEGQVTRQTGRGVYGYLPGMSDETVLIESHHDASTAQGAVEDASGAAEVMALARYFGQLPKSARPRTLMFATMDSHFTDYAVHRAFAQRHLREGNPSGDKVVAVVSVEHIGVEYLKGSDGGWQASGRLVPHALMVSTEVKGFKEIALNAMSRFGLERTFAVSTSLVDLVAGGTLPADSDDFWKVGLPVIAYVGAPLYLYDEADTPDKVARHDLNRVARAFASVVEQISALPSANFKRLPDKTAVH